MTRLVADSQLESIRNRRRQLRGQKRLRLFISTWRIVATTGLLATLVWLASSSQWVIQRPDQVVVEGNQYLSDEAIRNLLPLRYPQSLFRVQPQVLDQTLIETAPISKALISRQLFPPRLLLEVKDRPPVATTLCDRCTLVHPLPPNTATQRRPAPPQPLIEQPASTWLVDQQGKVAPLASYLQQQQGGKLPSLSVLGLFQPVSSSRVPNPSAASVSNPVAIDSTRQSQWARMYSLISHSPVKISQIDWRSNNNLTLETELGAVRLGAYSDRLPEQLKALAQMGKLPSYLNPKQVIYIDLTNPDRPLLQMRETGKTQAIN